MDIASYDRETSARYDGLTRQEFAVNSAGRALIEIAHPDNSLTRKGFAVNCVTPIIVNTLGRALVENHNELALIKAMGALDWHLMALSITQVVLYGATGTSIGIPLGMLLIRLLVSGYTKLIQLTQLVIVVSPAALGLSVIIGLGLPMLLAVLLSRFKYHVDLRFILNPFPPVVVPAVPRRPIAQGHALWRYIVRNLGRGRAGTMVIIAAVALAVGIFIGLHGFFTGIKELFISESNLSNHDLQIEFHEPAPQTVVEMIRAFDGVIYAEPQVDVYEQEIRTASNPRALKVEVVGILPNSRITTFAYYAGKNFSSGGSPAEILISTRVARELGLDIDDEVTIANSHRTIKAKVRGIIVDINNMGLVVYVPMPLAQTLTANEGMISRVLVKVQNGMRPRVTQAIREQYGGIAALYTREYWLETNLKQLALINIFLSVVVALVLLVVTIGLVDATTIRALERRNEIAILRALGGTRGQIAAMILGEQILIGLIGGLLAVGIGYGLAVGLTEWVSRSYFDVPFIFSPAWIVVSLLFSVVTCLIGGSIPLSSALRVMPARLLHRHAE